jgi:hypothetical protein
MTDSERQILQQRIARMGRAPESRGGVGRLLAWCLGLALCIVLAGALLLEAPGPVMTGVLGGVICLAGVLLLYGAFVLARSQIDQRRLRKYVETQVLPNTQAALTCRRVFVKRIRASSVIVIRAFEDEGDGYIFDVGQGRVLFLKGQEYHPASAGMNWPNAEFEIVRSLDRDVLVGIFCYGTKLEPVSTIDGRLYREEVIWEDREELAEATTSEFVARVTDADHDIL